MAALGHKEPYSTASPHDRCTFNCGRARAGPGGVARRASPSDHRRIAQNMMPPIAKIDSTASLPPSPPCRSRGRQRDRQRVAAHDHQGYEPPDRLLAVGVDPEEVGDVADRRPWSLSADFWRPRWRVPPRPALGVQILLVSREGGVGIGHVVARDVTVRELRALLADWEAERRKKGRAQVRARLLPGED